MNQVIYSSEHYLFLWKFFRHMSELNFSDHSPELLKRDNVSCFEVRNDYGELVACSISRNNTLLFSAVKPDYRGLGYQMQMITARLEAIQSFGYSYADVCVRCNNIASLATLLKAGFRVTKTFRYTNDDEGFVMEKEL